MSCSRNLNNLLSPYRGLSSFDNMFASPLFNNMESSRNLDRLRLDLTEHGSHFKVKADMPGMDKENIKVAVNNGLLQLSGHRSDSREETDASTHMHITERSYGSFSRSIPLPENVDSNGISAKYENGVLDVMLPKSHVNSTSKFIDIQ